MVLASVGLVLKSPCNYLGSVRSSPTAKVDMQRPLSVASQLSTLNRLEFLFWFNYIPILRILVVEVQDLRIRHCAAWLNDLAGHTLLDGKFDLLQIYRGLAKSDTASKDITIENAKG